MSKRKEKKEESSTPKKSKSDDRETYTLNANNCLDKKHEVDSFKTVIKLPPSALQGLANRADDILEEFKIKTIEDLAKWKYYKIAKAIKTLAEVEEVSDEKSKRDPKNAMNLNHALDKDWEKKNLQRNLEGSCFLLTRSRKMG